MSVEVRRVARLLVLLSMPRTRIHVSHQFSLPNTRSIHKSMQVNQDRNYPYHDSADPLEDLNLPIAFLLRWLRFCLQ